MVGIPTPARCALDGCDRLGVCIPNAQAHSAAPFKKHGRCRMSPCRNTQAETVRAHMDLEREKPRIEFRSYCAETGNWKSNRTGPQTEMANSTLSHMTTKTIIADRSSIPGVRAR